MVGSLRWITQLTKEVAYKTLVHPKLEYAAPIWSPYCKTQTQQVEKVQRRVARWTCRRWRNPRGGTLIFSYIRSLGVFLGVQNFEFQYFLGFSTFQKNEYFLGNEDFVDILLGHHKIGLYLGVIFLYFKVKVQIGGYFWGLLKFQIFFGVLEIPDIFFLGGGGGGGER